jgi:hypothetical protein
MDSFDALRLLLALFHALGFNRPADRLPHGFDESYNRVTFSIASSHRR